MWSGTVLIPPIWAAGRKLSGKKKDQGMWLKLVDPEEIEGERFETYEACLSADGRR